MSVQLIVSSGIWRRHHFPRGPLFAQKCQLRREDALTCLRVPEFQVPVVGRTEELCSRSVEADVSHGFTVT